MPWNRLLFFAFLIACSARGLAQVPSDESLVPSPSNEASNDQDSTDLLSRETLTGASPTDSIIIESVEDIEPIPVSNRKKSKGIDSSYVDTLGVGFWNKVLAPTYPNPERAAAMSFVLPGSGQIYNRRFAYIKVPVIYAGYALLIYSGETNRKLRNDFGRAYQLALKGEEHEFTGSRFDNPRVLQTNRDRLDKAFQLSYIGVGILHLVQVLEAYTTAHLLDFDMDESLSIAPVFIQPPDLGFSGSLAFDNRARLGIGLSYSFGR